MGQRLVGMALAAIATVGGATARAQVGSAAVRPEDPAVRALIASGMKRSATFRDLNTRLDETDVVVYVRFSRCDGGVAACLVWVPSGPGPRRLLIRLDNLRRPPDELTVLLAHELQHAHEVAAAPEVKDAGSFQSAFASRGWKHGNGFETEAARKVAALVAAELSRARGGSQGTNGGYTRRSHLVSFSADDGIDLPPEGGSHGPRAEFASQMLKAVMATTSVLPEGRDGIDAGGAQRGNRYRQQARGDDDQQAGGVGDGIEARRPSRRSPRRWASPSARSPPPRPGRRLPPGRGQPGRATVTAPAARRASWPRRAPCARQSPWPAARRRYDSTLNRPDTVSTSASPPRTTVTPKATCSR